MTLPRRLTLAAGDKLAPLRTEPAGDIESLRSDHRHVGKTNLPANKEVVLDSIKGNAMEIVAEITDDFSGGTGGRVGDRDHRLPFRDTGEEPFPQYGRRH